MMRLGVNDVFLSFSQREKPLQWLRLELLGMHGLENYTAGTLVHNDGDLTGGFSTNSDILTTRGSLFSE